MKNNKKIDKLFLGAGVMKAGTTWLYNVVREHPEIYFSFEKEIHFWSDYLNGTNYLGPGARLERVKSKFRNALESSDINHYRRLLTWSNIYLEPQISVDWYNRLFTSLNSSLSVYKTDFSNLTSHLSAASWQQLNSEVEKLKVIYVLRDPLKRLWSHIKFHHQHSGQEMDYTIWTTSDFRRIIKDRHMWINCEYAQAITNMRAVLTAEQFKIFYFEDFRADPQKQFRELEDFLEINHHHYSPQKVQKKVNSSKSIPMPEKFVAAAVPLLTQEVEQLEKIGVDIHSNWSTLAV